MVLPHTITHMTMIDNPPDAVRETYFKMKRERGKKVELKVIGGNYYIYAARGVWDKKRREPVNVNANLNLAIFGNLTYHFSR